MSVKKAWLIVVADDAAEGGPGRRSDPSREEYDPVKNRWGYQKIDGILTITPSTMADKYIVTFRATPHHEREPWDGRATALVQAVVQEIARGWDKVKKAMNGSWIVGFSKSDIFLKYAGPEHVEALIDAVKKAVMGNPWLSLITRYEETPEPPPSTFGWL